MAEQKTKKECPECCGEKNIPGVCECASEWRGTQIGEECHTSVHWAHNCHLTQLKSQRFLERRMNS